MGVITSLTLTRAGQSLRTMAMAGQPFTITRAAVGAGAYPDEESLYGALALADERQAARRIGEERGQDHLTVSLAVDNADIAEGYAVREVGLYARGSDDADEAPSQPPETLFAVAILRDFPDYLLPPETPGVPTMEYNYHLTFTLADGAAVAFASPSIRASIDALHGAADSLERMETLAREMEDHGHDASRIDYGNDALPGVSSVKGGIDAALERAGDALDGLQALSAALEDAGGASEAARVTLGPVEGMVSLNAQEGIEEVFALASKGVSAIIEGATGYYGEQGGGHGGSTTLREQADYIRAAKAVAIERLAEKGVNADPGAPLMALAEGIAGADFPLDEITPSSREWAVYEEDTERGDLLALRRELHWDALNDFGGYAPGAYCDMALSSDRSTAVFLGTANPRAVVYTRNAYGYYAEAAVLELPADYTMSTTEWNGCAVSSDGLYVAVGLNALPWLALWKRDGDGYAYIGSGNAPLTGACYRMRFSPDDAMLAVAHAFTPYFSVYDVAGGAFARFYTPNDIPGGAGRDVAFSPDGRWLAVANDAGGGCVYGLDLGARAIPRRSALSGWVGGNGLSCDWHPSGEYVFFGAASSPYMNGYFFDAADGAAERLSNPALPPTAAVSVLRFADDGEVFLAGSYLYAFSLAGVSARYASPIATDMPTSACVLWRGDGRLTMRTTAAPWRATYTVDTAAQTCAVERMFTGNNIGALVCGERLVLFKEAAPWLEMYAIGEGGALTPLPLPFAPLGAQHYRGSAHADGETAAFAVPGASPYLYVVNLRTGAVVTPDAAPVRAVYSCAWSPTAPSFLMAGLAGTSTSAAELVTLYEYTGVALPKRTVLNMVSNGIPVTDIAFSPIGERFFFVRQDNDVYTGVLMPNTATVSGVAKCITMSGVRGITMMGGEHLLVTGNNLTELYFIQGDGEIVKRAALTGKALLVTAPGTMTCPVPIGDGGRVIALASGSPFVFECEAENAVLNQRVSMKSLASSSLANNAYTMAFDGKRGILYVPAIWEGAASTLLRFKARFEARARPFGGDFTYETTAGGMKRSAIALSAGSAGEKRLVHALARAEDWEDGI